MNHNLIITDSYQIASEIQNECDVEVTTKWSWTRLKYVYHIRFKNIPETLTEPKMNINEMHERIILLKRQGQGAYHSREDIDRTLNDASNDKYNEEKYNPKTVDEPDINPDDDYYNMKNNQRFSQFRASMIGLAITIGIVCLFAVGWLLGDFMLKAKKSFQEKVIEKKTCSGYTVLDAQRVILCSGDTVKYDWHLKLKRIPK